MCGGELEGSRRILPINPENHNYEWFVKRVEPTCRTAGEVIYRCSLCRNPSATHSTPIEPDPEKNHVIPETRTHYKDPTCEYPGYDVYQCLERSKGCMFEETRNEVPALGMPHKWEIKSETKVTCTTDGVKVEKCKKCNDYQTTTTPATGHKDNNNDKKCDICKKSLKKK